MTPQELKASILQLAIQGKLVEQRPEEGTGAELLEKILAAFASAKASADKKNAKSAKNNLTRRRGERAAFAASSSPSCPVCPGSPVPPADAPFDIPESWVWVRLGEVADVQLGKMLDKRKNKGTPYPYLANLSVRWGSFDLSSLKMMPFTKDECDKFALHSGDVLMCEGGVPGRCAVWRQENSQIKYQKAVHRIRSKALLPDFIQHFFEAICDSSRFASQFTGTTIKHLPRETLVQMLIPLPPLAEQKRIVAKIEELLPYIDRYEKAWSKLEEFNKRFPDDMQKSLLQMAIQGKLVEQRPEEGTGEELYRQIQSEKQRLIKSGKIKKEKPLPEITPDEIPFDIPESWKWVSFLSVVDIATNLVSPTGHENDRHIAPDNIEKGTGRLLDSRTVAEDKVVSSNHQFFKGQLIYSKIRPLLRKVVIAPFDGLCSADMYPLNTKLDASFLLFYMLSDAFNLQIAKAMSSRVKMPKINQEELSRVLLPLPPLAEQKRIVAKLEELLPLCELLK